MTIFWNRERHAIEMNRQRDSETEPEALDQIARYLDSAKLVTWLLAVRVLDAELWGRSGPAS